MCTARVRGTWKICGMVDLERVFDLGLHFALIQREHSPAIRRDIAGKVVIVVENHHQDP